MANATVNAKTSKKGLLDFIRSQKKAVKEDNLKSRITYALGKVDKDESSVTKSDLYDLAKEIMAVLTPTTLTPAVENSPKPKLGKKKSEAPKEDKKADEKSEAPAEEKVSKPKKSAPKSKEKKPAVETTDGLTSKDLPLARIFPKEIDHEALGKLVACPDKYHSVEEIREALAEDKNLIFACYWTKRHIKEFAYGQSYEVPFPKGGFPYDLDTLQALYVCEGIDRIYALSTYTEAMFRFVEEDLVPTECEANDGSKFMMRYSAGLEFEIYEVAEA